MLTLSYVFLIALFAVWLDRFVFISTAWQKCC